MSKLLEHARHGAAARPARQGDPGAVLRVGPALERAGRSGSRTTSTCPAAWCGCWGRGARSGSSRSTRPRRRALRAWLPDREHFVRRGQTPVAGVRGQTPVVAAPGVRPRSSRRTRQPLFLNYRGGRLSTRSVDKLVRRYVAAVQHPLRHQPARAAPFLRHPPARGRRRSARHSGTARPRPPQHDPALHARQRRATDRNLPQGAPEGVT